MNSGSTNTTYSDSELEVPEQRWIQLLLSWLNRCVHPKAPVRKLNKRSLWDVICKYKQDICGEDLLTTIMNPNDVEPFIRYHYPLLKLKYICDEKDIYKKLYIMTAVLMYHCCVSSIDGRVDSDICAHLNRSEQEMILMYCERLTDMTITVKHVQCAIKDACRAVKPVKIKNQPNIKILPNKNVAMGSGETCQTLDNPAKPLVPWSMVCPPSISELSKKKKICFDSSILVLPSAMTETSSYSDNEYVVNYDSLVELVDVTKICQTTNAEVSSEEARLKDSTDQTTSSDYKSTETPQKNQDKVIGTAMSERGKTVDGNSERNLDYYFGRMGDNFVKNFKKYRPRFRSRKKYPILICLAIFLILALIISFLFVPPWTSSKRRRKLEENSVQETARKYYVPSGSYTCRNNLCQTAYAPTTDRSYQSMSRCILKCMGPQLWPHPIGYTFYNKKIVALATSQLEYKFQSVPSESVLSHLSRAFEIFIEDLVKLEENNTKFKDINAIKDLPLRKMNIQLKVESDPDPRVRVDTDETYNLKVDVVNNILTVIITSPSFCGVRHGLETLSQMILTDPVTGYLITLSNVVITDGPSYRYRGLMIDTGRNYIPVPDLMRTIDAMATCKLNTFHWRISDVTSFPLIIPSLPQLFQYGVYDKTLIYTKKDVKAIVTRARIRGIRVLIEVAAPGPVGRAWSWSPDVSCPTKATNYTCNNYLCLRLAIRTSVLDALQIIYSEIIEMTNVEDIFHLSDSLFSMANCYYLIEDREGFLDKALERLKLANKGFMPKLPIIWYTKHLSEDIEAKCWERLGVQLTGLQPNASNQALKRFKVIDSSRWDLSCEVKKNRCIKYRTWQGMYSWKPWSSINSFTTEGGESLLWTDLVDSANLDIHLWPRAAAVAERLWSDTAINSSVSPSMYIRLDNYRWRLMRKSVKVQPIWPMYCSSNPEECLMQLRSQK